MVLLLFWLSPSAALDREITARQWEALVEISAQMKAAVVCVPQHACTTQLAVLVNKQWYDMRVRT